MKPGIIFFTVFASLYAGNAHASAVFVGLGTAEPFAVLGASAITNTGSSVIDGNLGISPGTALTGFPPGTVNGTVDNSNAVAMQAETDLTTAYNFAAGEACGDNLTGQDLGGLTLTPGVYCFSSSAQLTGTLDLDAQGNPNAVFVFQIGSTLTTAGGSAVDFLNGGQGGDLFWQVGSSATLGTTTAFEGSILALTSITLDTGATIGCGRALASNGAVTLDTNVVSIASEGGCEATGSSGVPEPGTGTLLSIGLACGGAGCFLRKRTRATLGVNSEHSDWSEL
jgi:Ice-binding-like